MANDRKRVLVLCTGNSCRSQMAEGWINALLGERWEARSAGTAPAARVHASCIRPSSGRATV
jgi:arsenate reductase